MTEKAWEELRAQLERLEADARRLPPQPGLDELVRDIAELRAKLPSETR